jgi:dynein light chain Tctex-type 1
MSSTGAPASAPSRPTFSSVSEVLKASTQTRVQSVIGDAEYKHELVRTWTSNICDAVLEDAKSLCLDYKIMVSVVIVQKNGAGLNTHAAAYWDPTTDGSIAVTVDSKHMVAIVTIFACAL